MGFSLVAVVPAPAQVALAPHAGIMPVYGAMEVRSAPPASWTLLTPNLPLPAVPALRGTNVAAVPTSMAPAAAVDAPITPGVAAVAMPAAAGIEAAPALNGLHEAAALDGPLRDDAGSMIFDGANMASRQPAHVPAALRATKHSLQPQALKALLDRVSAVAAAGGTPIVLFDIDDTLVDSAGRTLRIFREFLAEPEIQRLYPEESRRLQSRLSLENIRFSNVETIKEAGIANAGFVERFAGYWKDRFFQNAYLPEDPAHPGAVDFVHEVVRRGGVAVYFTGRWEDMRSGTEDLLNKRGFPKADGRRVMLVMKPDRNETDEAFKARELPSLGRLGVVVGGFENEPINVDIFKRQFPSALMIFVKTKSAQQKDPVTRRPIEVDPSIPWVGDFKLPR